VDRAHCSESLRPTVRRRGNPEDEWDLQIAVASSATTMIPAFAVH
jgi:hypothetical protein